MQLKNKLSTMNGWQRTLIAIGIVWLIICFFISAAMASESYSSNHFVFISVYTISSFPVWATILGIWVYKGFTKPNSVTNNNLVSTTDNNDIRTEKNINIIHAIRSILIGGWKGKEKLWKVFWVISVPTDLVLRIFSTLNLHGIMGLVLLLAYLASTIWITVANWRCAYNVERRIWGILIRYLIVISYTIIVISIIAAIAIPAITK